MSSRENGRYGFRRDLALLALLAVLGMSCSSTPPATEDGLYGLVYSRVNKEKPDKPARENVNGGGELVSTPESVRVNNHTEHATEPPPYLAERTDWLNYTPLQYRVSAGDMLRVSYFRRPPGDALAAYRVEVGDVLSVSVDGRDMISQDVTVRPDGKISFYHIDDIDVRGKTIPEVREALARSFADVIPSAEVSLFLKQGNVLLNDFLSTVRSEGEGTTRRLRVRQDGLVNFPLVGEINVVGKSLPDLARLLEDSYDDLFGRGLAVTVNMLSSADGNVAVLGEVRRPGMFTIYRPIHPMYALAMAGGSLPTAGAKDAVLLKQHADGTITRHRPNLDPKQRMNDPGLVMEPQDILVVPRSGIANVNLWIEQYIRRMLPLRTHFGFGYSLNDD